MVHINNRLVTPPGDSTSPARLPSLSQSEIMVDRDKEGSSSACFQAKENEEKNHKKRLKVDRDYEEEEEEEELA